MFLYQYPDTMALVGRPLSRRHIVVVVWYSNLSLEAEKVAVADIMKGQLQTCRRGMGNTKREETAVLERRG